jgi:hypothetical protein
MLGIVGLSAAGAALDRPSVDQLSGYEHLLRRYWTLVTLPVTSCSVERVLSLLKIIKKQTSINYV